MSQIYNNNTMPKENQLGILEISSMEFMHFAGEGPRVQEKVQLELPICL